MVCRATFFAIAICALSIVNGFSVAPIESKSLQGSNDEDKKSPIIVELAADDPLRGKRSPQFDAEYDDYSDDTDYAESRHLKIGHRRRKHRKPHLHGLHGHGCRGYACGQAYGWQPQQGGYYHQGPQSGQSFASASAGTVGNRPSYGGSQANAQSATFSLGPYSATFSHAEASASNHNNRPGSFFDY